AFPNPAESDGTVEFYRQAFARIARSPVRDRIQLLGDSDALIEEYRTIDPELTFALAPIPHLRGAENGSHGTHRFRVGYAGAARDNKGFHLLPRLVRIAAEARVPGIEFHIHSFAHNPSAAFLRRALAGLRHPSVTLYPDEMPAAEYP